MTKNVNDPRELLVKTSRRIVVKVGSGVLTTSSGLNVRRIGLLVSQISNMIHNGREFVIVSSGAIAAGFKRVGLTEKPRIIQKAQACAAVGQARLIMAYEKSFERRGHKVAQILLTANDLFHRHRYINAKNTLKELLDWRIIPIVNENDTVTVSEIRFGDNDTLGGMITGLVEADLFINLTDIEGLYDRDPRSDSKAVFQSVINPEDDGVAAMASKIPGSLGAGGMYTKVVAARRLARQGVPSIIASGRKPRILECILAGEPEGTLFLPRSEPMSQRKHWIAMSARPRCGIVVDDGAKQALLARGKSLLPIGVLAARDHFDRGDSVQVLDQAGELIAVGLSNYSSDELVHIIGCQSCDIEGRLGYKPSDEVIHRDNMVVGDDLKI